MTNDKRGVRMVKLYFIYAFFSLVVIVSFGARITSYNVCYTKLLRVIQGVETVNGEKISGKYVILSPGRSGAEWLQTESQIHGLKTVNNPVDIGVRVELLASVMEKLTKALYEPKLVYFSKQFDDQVRTFCVSPYGEVTTESYDGVLTVNGGSHAETRTPNTNFAIV